jgi:hypothetical protein
MQSGKFPLLLAALKNNQKIMLALLNRSSVQVNLIEEITGDTALHGMLWSFFDHFEPSLLFSTILSSLSSSYSLVVCARNDYAALVALLLYGQASPNVPNLRGESARDLIMQQPATSKARDVLRAFDENASMLTETLKETYPILNALHSHEIQFLEPVATATT